MIRSISNTFYAICERFQENIIILKSKISYGAQSNQKIIEVF